MTLQNNTLNICFFHLLLKSAFSQRAHNKRHFQQNFILSLFLFHLISLSCYTPGSQFTREEPNLLAANQNTLLPYSAASDSAPDSLFCPKTTTDRNYALLPRLLSFPKAGINNPALPWFFSFSDNFFRDFLSPCHNIPSGEYLFCTHQNYRKRPEQGRRLTGCSSSWSCFCPNLKAQTDVTRLFYLKATWN